MFICNYKFLDGTEFVLNLPSYIKDLDSAHKFINSDNDFCINYFGVHKVLTVEIYEVSSYKKINVQRDEELRKKEENPLPYYYGFEFSFIGYDIKQLKEKYNKPWNQDSYSKQAVEELDWLEDKFLNVSFASEEMLLNSREIKILNKYEIFYKIIKFKGFRPYSYV